MHNKNNKKYMKKKSTKYIYILCICYKNQILKKDHNLDHATGYYQIWYMKVNCEKYSCEESLSIILEFFLDENVYWFYY